MERVKGNVPLPSSTGQSADGAVASQLDWGPRPPRALAAGALAGGGITRAHSLKGQQNLRLQKWLAGAPATAPGPGALPYNCIPTTDVRDPILAARQSLVGMPRC